MGDASDNIPGLPGVGDKTAKKFIAQFGSMEGLFENIGQLKGKMKEKVEEKDFGVGGKLNCLEVRKAENFRFASGFEQKTEIEKKDEADQGREAT